MRNLFCHNNKLEKLVLGNQPELNTIVCYNNYLRSLNVNGYTKLETLCCNNNNHLTSLNIDGCTNLTILTCYTSKLKSLLVSNCNKLINVDCRNNSLSGGALDDLFGSLNSTITSGVTKYLYILDNLGTADCNIDIAKGKGWTVDYKPSSPTIVTMTTKKSDIKIVLRGSGFAVIDWGDGTNKPYTLSSSECECTHNYSMPALCTRTITITGTTITYLKCSDNQLTTLHVIGNPLLMSLDCSTNQLTSLDVTGLSKLVELRCDFNQLTSLDVTGNSLLFTLSCTDNKLMNLRVSGLARLANLICNNNQLISLDVTGNANLSCFYCQNNNLTSLSDLRELTRLSIFYCYSNKLTSLDVSGLSNLVYLYCYSNDLTCLDVSGCAFLQIINCVNNLMFGDALNSLFSSLNSTVRSGVTKYLYILGNSGVDSCNVEIATAKGWTLDYKPTTITMETSKISVVIVLKGSGSALIDWGDGTDKSNYALSSSDSDCTHVYSSSALRTITLTGTAITYMDCSDNKLTSLNVTKNSSLTTLHCYSNSFTSLSVEGLTNLTYLDCRVDNLNTDALDGLFGSLNSTVTSGVTKYLHILGNPGLNFCKIDVATRKGWTLDYKPAIMTMVTAKSSVKFSVRGRGFVLINWGDGMRTSYQVKDSSGSIEFIHSYSSSTPHTITLTSDSFINLVCENNQLTALDVTGNSSLTTLRCQDNLLKSLNVNGLINLTTLDCRNNSLSDVELNRLFGSLSSPMVTKSIYIIGNPGTTNCDTTIATKKGWTVDYQ